MKPKNSIDMRRFFIIVAVAVLGALALQAGVRDDFKAHPKMSANNYQAYPDTVLPAITAAPEGYEPFFINHYGRHGSRWLINEKKYTYPLQMLEKGERNGKLTRRGQEVLNILRQVHEASRGRLGELSDIGAEQHQRIARRMYQNFPQVFAQPALENHHRCQPGDDVLHELQRQCGQAPAYQQKRIGR